MAGPTLQLRGPELSADIAIHGAELVRLQDGDGRDLLWDGDPRFWTGHAPLLFPIVGRVAGDHITVDGRAYPMRQHGLARLSDFQVVGSEVIEAEPARCRLRLSASPESRAIYPFEFTLEVTYAIEGARLAIRAEVGNVGDRPMPAAFGFHPAFPWPLPDSPTRDGHEIVFEHDEAEPIRRVAGGLLTPERVPTPVQGRILPLRDELFAHDAVILDHPASRRVLYRGPGPTALEVTFPQMREVAFWSKPGAGFVCIEPWAGHASPEGFDGELSDKPGMTIIEPGGSAVFGMTVAVVGREDTL